MQLCRVLALACATLSLGRATLIGSAADPKLPSTLGVLYSIDPITGNTVPLGRTFSRFGLADSPFPGTIFGSSPINLYTLNLITGALENFNNQGDLELAFDSDHGIMYGTNYSSLITISMIRCDGGCPPIAPQQSFAGGPIWAMGYVPGDGLYGVDSVLGNLYRINPANAALTFIGNTGIGQSTTGFGITDIEYDPATGRMIAVAGGPKTVFGCSPPDYLCGPPLDPFGKIYSLDWHTGSVTLLNDHAPNFFGLAEVAPEPSTLVLTGLSALLIACKSRRFSSRN